METPVEIRQDRKRRSRKAFRLLGCNRVRAKENRTNRKLCNQHNTRSELTHLSYKTSRQKEVPKRKRRCGNKPQASRQRCYSPKELSNGGSEGVIVNRTPWTLYVWRERRLDLEYQWRERDFVSRKRFFSPFIFNIGFIYYWLSIRLFNMLRFPWKAKNTEKELIIILVCRICDGMGIDCGMKRWGAKQRRCSQKTREGGEWKLEKVGFWGIWILLSGERRPLDWMRGEAFEALMGGPYFILFYFVNIVRGTHCSAFGNRHILMLHQNFSLSVLILARFWLVFNGPLVNKLS